MKIAYVKKKEILDHVIYTTKSLSLKSPPGICPYATDTHNDWIERTRSLLYTRAAHHPYTQTQSDDSRRKRRLQLSDARREGKRAVHYLAPGLRSLSAKIEIPAHTHTHLVCGSLSLYVLSRVGAFAEFTLFFCAPETLAFLGLHTRRL